VDNTVARALALAPLGLALHDVVLADGVAAGNFKHVSLYAAVAVNTALATWDHSKLELAESPSRWDGASSRSRCT